MDGRRSVSVIIPAYNAADTIGQQLEALSTQQCDGLWEVLVADNGSTDRTVEVSRSFESLLPTLRVVDASERQGAAHARNQGARYAKGELLLFVDADDVVQSGWLKAMAEAGQVSPLIAGSGSPVKHRDAAGVLRKNRGSAIFPARGFLDAAGSGNLGAHRELFERLGGFRENFRYCEDTAFCWDAQLSGETLDRVPGAVIWYRQRQDLGSLWRQQYNWGQGAVQLFVSYRSEGAPPSSTVGAILRWLALITSAPIALALPSRRRGWVLRVARRTGRLAGSVKFRVLHL